VFEPRVNGKKEKFRLVGMDHFNAMLEDATTKSWWRQVNGEAIAGKLKGQQLPEVYSTNIIGRMAAVKSFITHHAGRSAFINKYDSTMKYESGASKSKLTGTDSLSWKDKSWVVGIKTSKASKAYDWNQLKMERMIQDTIGNTPILLVLATDNKSFFAFEKHAPEAHVDLRNDTLIFNNSAVSYRWKRN
jgi:hypothetical protein